MRVAGLTAYFVRNRLKRAVRHASYARTSTDNLVIRCRLDNGSEGWGEGLPRPYVTGETIDTAGFLLRTTRWSRRLGGGFENLGELIELLSNFRLGGRPASGRGCFGNSVRCAVELAVLDAACRAWGLPLSAVTEHVPETAAIRERLPRLQYSMAITAASPGKQVLRALTARVGGFRHCKVKVGVDGIDDVALLRRVRRWIGPEVDLRIDANEAWTAAELSRKLEPLIPSGISCVEQPVPHAEVNELAKVREAVCVPIMLDESLCSLTDGRHAIEAGLCDLFNIRLSKCGGFLNALRLAGMAHQAGLGYQLGCQVGESGILSAAGRHFAASVAGVRYLEGSFDRYLVKARLTRQDVSFGFGGYAPALGGPGLGIDVDPRAVERIAFAVEPFDVS